MTISVRANNLLQAEEDQYSTDFWQLENMPKFSDLWQKRSIQTMRMQWLSSWEPNLQRKKKNTRRQLRTTAKFFNWTLLSSTQLIARHLVRISLAATMMLLLLTILRSRKTKTCRCKHLEAVVLLLIIHQFVHTVVEVSASNHILPRVVLVKMVILPSEWSPSISVMPLNSWLRWWTVTING